MRDNLVGDGQLFQPDTVLPSQFYAGMNRNTVLDPAHRLVLAVFQDAIECYQKHWAATDPKSRQLFDDAREWIWSDDSEWPYAFLNVCDLLGMHVEYVRNGLEAWLQRQRRTQDHVRVVPIDRCTARTQDEAHPLRKAS